MNSFFSNLGSQKINGRPRGAAMPEAAPYRGNDLPVFPYGGFQMSPKITIVRHKESWQPDFSLDARRLDFSELYNVTTQNKFRIPIRIAHADGLSKSDLEILRRIHDETNLAVVIYARDYRFIKRVRKMPLFVSRVSAICGF
jgi:hypothetical protein